MKVKTLLAQAAKCKTQANADKLIDTLQRVFGNTKPVCNLYIYNIEACMVDGKPFVSFELNHEISEHFITMICPEIRDGKFVVNVVTSHMLDGLGMSSQSWEVVEGMEDTIESYDDTQPVATLAQRAKELAIANHAQLIERVGVSHSVALYAAE